MQLVGETLPKVLGVAPDARVREHLLLQRAARGRELGIGRE
jgi:hypothetical protein